MQLRTKNNILGGPKYLPGVGVRGRARRAFSMEKVRPSSSLFCRPSLAASASSEVTILTKPKPRDSLVWGSRMIWHFSTVPYLEKRRVTSSSVRRGWMPVTNKLEPGLTAPSSSRRSSLGGALQIKENVSGTMTTPAVLVGRLYRSPAPGEAERRRVLSLPLSLRGEALRLSRS